MMSLEAQYEEAQRLLEGVKHRKERVQQGLPEIEETLPKLSKDIEEQGPDPFLSETRKTLNEILDLVKDLNQTKELKNAEDPTLLKLTKLISDLNAKFTSEMDAQTNQRDVERQTLDAINAYIRKWT